MWPRTWVMLPKTLVALPKKLSCPFFLSLVKHLSIQSLCGVVRNQHHLSDKVSQVWEMFVSMIQVNTKQTVQCCNTSLCCYKQAMLLQLLLKHISILII